ncbi:MAG: hypothetical protein Q4P28_05650, partial [Tissierellia bacterium]|nr:hypothetical protein [Tissierellia bacterium]
MSKIENPNSQKMETVDISDGNLKKLEGLDLYDPSTLDHIKLSKTQRTRGGLIALITSFIAIMVFFVPLPAPGGGSSILFGTIYQGA